MRLFSFLIALLLLSPPPAQAGTRFVAIIDSGVAATSHLRPLLVAEYDFGGPAARPPFRPRYDHGTMVATILSNEMREQVRIVSMRIDDPAGCPPHKDPPCQPVARRLAAAIRMAIALRVDAINISLALADDDEIVAAIGEAARQGIIVVMAAGNDGLSHPGNLRMARVGYPKAVLVGALDATGKPWPMSNRPGADTVRDYSYVWRLGVGIPTSLADGRLAQGTGTSFAAPIETARQLLALSSRSNAAAR
jgi:subtilisin family serine protease